ncbi:hypothetical protein OAK35_04300 [Crocinitomicaceae bacterium]|nr:hypothetical protein [Crocinitomicaceae bacterium]
MKIIAFPILLTLLLLSGISHAQDSTTARIYGADVVSLRCEGTCDCSLEGILDTKVQCTCNECTKVITITESGLQGETSATIYNLEDASIEAPLVEEFFDYTDSSGGGIILEELELYRNGDDVAVLFMYTDADGGSQTVMFARVGGKTYRISCDGDCGCREEYSFETNSASCSCEDCVMTVEEVTNQ